MRASTLAVVALTSCLSACGAKEEPSRPAAGAGVAPDTATRPVPAPVVDTPPPAAPARAAAPPAPSPRPAPVRPATTQATPVPAPAAVSARDEWHPPPRDTLSSETYQGWKQYELNCSRCHGEYAVGTSFAPALTVSLKEGGTIPTKEAFVTTVCAGRPDKGMPGWCALGLEMAKIEQMYLYVKGRADGTYSPGRPALRE